MGRLKEPTRVCPNMVPMIDIVSQLVIFFMLASTFISAEVDNAVELPDLTDSIIDVKGDSTSSQFRVVVNVACDPAAPTVMSTIKIGGIDMIKSARDAAPAVDPAKAAVKNLIDRLKIAKKIATDKGGKLQVIIRADKRLLWGSIQQIMGAVTMAGIGDVRLAGPAKKQG